MFKLITSLPSSRCFLYGLTGTILHVTFTASGSTDTPLPPNHTLITKHQQRARGPCFRHGSALIGGSRCGGECDVISVYQPTEHSCSSGCKQLIQQNKSCKLNTPAPRGVNGIHVVTSLMTSHLCHSAVQSDTLPDDDMVITSGCASVYFFFLFFFFYCIVTLFIYIKVACCRVVRGGGI